MYVCVCVCVGEVIFRAHGHFYYVRNVRVNIKNTDARRIGELVIIYVLYGERNKLCVLRSRPQRRFNGRHKTVTVRAAFVMRDNVRTDYLPSL